MPIDTKIDGDPKSVRSAADWLRSTLASKVSHTADEIRAARATAVTDWHGDAGDAFSARMDSGAAKIDTLKAAIGDGSQVIDDFAEELERAQSDMQMVRDNALNAGLTVDGFVIQEAVEEAKIHAYNAAAHAADQARIIEKLATDTLNNMWNDIATKWHFTAGDLINTAVGAIAAAQASRLLGNAKWLASDSAKWMELAKSAPEGTPASVIYRDFDRARALAYQADDLAKRAESLKSTAGSTGLKVGGGLAIAGVVYDIANGKDVDQAIVSGSAGFAASVAAGALIGTAIPVPIVGTAVGALGGAVVGMFASGAVDSLYQNGIGSLGDAISDGASAVTDAGNAVGGLAKGAWNAIF